MIKVLRARVSHREPYSAADIFCTLCMCWFIWISATPGIWFPCAARRLWTSIPMLLSAIQFRHTERIHPGKAVGRFHGTFEDRLASSDSQVGMSRNWRDTWSPCYWYHLSSTPSRETRRQHRHQQGRKQKWRKDFSNACSSLQSFQ
jgi:hypothetical protein